MCNLSRRIEIKESATVTVWSQILIYLFGPMEIKIYCGQNKDVSNMSFNNSSDETDDITIKVFSCKGYC